MSDRSITPSNFHYFEQVEDKVEKKSHKTSVNEDRKKFVTFIEGYVTANERNNYKDKSKKKN